MAFSSVFMCVFAFVFRRMFQVLHRSSDAYCECFSFGCLKSRSGVDAGDPPAAAANVRSGEAEDERVHAWGRAARAPHGHVKRSAGASV
jgi:hypothetical protein